MPSSEIISWDSIPQYDGFGSSPLMWDASDWLQYAVALQAKYGRVKGNTLWAKAWLDGVSILGGGYGKAEGSGYLLDSVPIDVRSFNSSFKDFISANGNEILYEAVYSGLTGELGKLIGGTISVGENVGTTVKKVVKNVGDTVSNTSKVFSYVIPILLIVGAVLILSVANKKLKAI